MVRAAQILHQALPSLLSRAGLKTNRASPRQRRSLSSPHLWVSSTYFAEGFPYAVVHQLAEVLFRELGASLQVIGLTSLLHLPYNLKFLWAPLADAFATKRAWLLTTEAVLGTTLVGMAFMTRAGALLGVTALAFAILAFASATPCQKASFSLTDLRWDRTWSRLASTRRIWARASAGSRSCW